MWLTYRQAAKRTGRSLNTVKRWRRQGMPMETDPRGRRIVHQKVLMAWFRARLMADPIMQQKRRQAAAQREGGAS